MDVCPIECNDLRCLSNLCYYREELLSELRKKARLSTAKEECMSKVVKEPTGDALWRTNMVEWCFKLEKRLAFIESKFDVIREVLIAINEKIKE